MPSEVEFVGSAYMYVLCDGPGRTSIEDGITKTSTLPDVLGGGGGVQGANKRKLT